MWVTGRPKTRPFLANCAYEIEDLHMLRSQVRHPTIRCPLDYVFSGLGIHPDHDVNDWVTVKPNTVCSRLSVLVEQIKASESPWVVALDCDWRSARDISKLQLAVREDLDQKIMEKEDLCDVFDIHLSELSEQMIKMLKFLLLENQVVVFFCDPPLKALVSSGILSKGTTFDSLSKRQKLPWRDLHRCFSDGWHLKSLQGVCVKRERVLLLFEMHVAVRQWSFAKCLMDTVPVDRQLRKEALELRRDFFELISSDKHQISADQIKNRFDVSLLGCSNRNLGKDFQPPSGKHDELDWKDCFGEPNFFEVLYNQKWFGGQKWPPLCVETASKHPDDLYIDLCRIPLSALGDVVPLNHFEVIVILSSFLVQFTDMDIGSEEEVDQNKNLAAMLKPGGHIIVLGNPLERFKKYGFVKVEASSFTGVKKAYQGKQTSSSTVYVYQKAELPTAERPRSEVVTRSKRKSASSTAEPRKKSSKGGPKKNRKKSERG